MDLEQKTALAKEFEKARNTFMAAITLGANHFALIHRFTKSAFEQAERNELEKANASIDHIEVRPVQDTKPNVCGRIEQQFGVYEERRKTHEIMADLLASIVYNLLVYSTLEPGFLKEQLNSFAAVQRAVAALPEPKFPSSKPTAKRLPPTTSKQSQRNPWE